MQEDWVEQLLEISRVKHNTYSSTCEEVLQEITHLLASSSKSIDADTLCKEFCTREEIESTYLNHGVAIPHIRSTQVKKPVGALIKLNKGLCFCKTNNDLVDIFFGFIVPHADNDLHLRILAGIAEKFNSADFRKSLRHTMSNQELFTTAITKI